MPITDAQKRARDKFDEKLDSIRIRPKREDGQRIRDAAAARDVTITRLVVEAVDAYIGHENE
jgi:uncharacterized protein (DUF1778 family)